MIISVTGRHFEIRDDLKTYIIKKLEGFSKYSSRIIDARVIIEFSRGIHRAELLVAANHLKYFVESDDPDIRGAVDKVIKKMDAQLRNHKERIKQKHKKNRRPPTPGEEIGDEIDEVIDEDYLE